MTNYKKMYYQLFNKVTHVIHKLQEIQQYTEQMFIDNSDTTPLLDTYKDIATKDSQPTILK